MIGETAEGPIRREITAAAFYGELDWHNPSAYAALDGYDGADDREILLDGWFTYADLLALVERLRAIRAGDLVIDWEGEGG